MMSLSCLELLLIYAALTVFLTSIFLYACRGDRDSLIGAMVLLFPFYCILGVNYFCYFLGLKEFIYTSASFGIELEVLLLLLLFMLATSSKVIEYFSRGLKKNR